MVYQEGSVSEQFLSGPVRASRLQIDGAEVGKLDIKLAKDMLIKLMMVMSIDSDVINQF